MAKKSIMTPTRVANIKDMLSSRAPVERDNGPMMQAVNKAKVKKVKKSFAPKSY